MKLIAALLLVAAVPAQAAGLTVRTGETWIFTVKNGEPAQARRVAPSARIPKGQIKVSVRAMLGTAMTVTNNSTIAYTYQAELLSGGKPSVGTRSKASSQSTELSRLSQGWMMATSPSPRGSRVR